VLILQRGEIELRAGDTSEAAGLMEEWDQWAALLPEAAVIGARVDAVLAALRGEPGRTRELTASVLETSESEAHFGWGRPEEADEVIGRFGRLATEQRHPWGLATLKRSRAATKPGYFPQVADRLLAEDATPEPGRWDAARPDRALTRERRDNRGRARRATRLPVRGRRAAPGEHEIMVRAWDSSASTQPEDEAARYGTPRATSTTPAPRRRIRAA
jgi:hypothetical protein